MKHGQVESYSFLIGLLITIAIVVVFIMFIVPFFSGEDEQKLSVAKSEFLNVSKFYKSCVSNTKTDCFCGSFDVGKIRQAGYSVYLSKMLGQSHLVLTEFGVLPDVDGLISKDSTVDKSSFNEQLVCTFGYDGSKFVDTNQRVYDLTGGRAASLMGDKVPVLKIGSKFCVYETSQDLNLDILRRKFAGCNAVLDSSKLILLDSADDVASRQVANFLLKYLSEKVGRVDAFFTGKYEGRAEWFDKVYSDEGDGFLASRIFLVYVKTSADAFSSKDRIVIHYLKDSVSDAFANAVGSELKTLEGKYYYNSVEEAKLGTVPESYRFNTEVVYEANDPANPDGAYLVCDKDELQICKEKLQIPAVFIEFVDANDGFSAYQGHEEILAETIRQGMLNYVMSPSVYGYVPKGSDQPLFP